MMNSFYSLIPKLKGIEFVKAKELLGMVAEASKCGECANFWELCRILRNASIDERNKMFSQWIARVVSLKLPKEIDPYIKALFTNNTEEARKIGETISPLLGLLVSSEHNQKLKHEKVPEFFNEKKFKYGTQEITGGDVWMLLTTKFDQLSKYDFPKIIIFALFFFYGGYSDLTLAITNFKKFNTLQNDKKADRIMAFLSVYDKPKIEKSDILMVSKLLPPVDAFFFLKLFSVIDDVKLNDSIFTSAANNAAYVLIKKGSWEYAVAIYNTVDQEEKAKLVMEQNSSTELEMTNNELRLIEEIKVPEDDLLEAKAKKAFYECQFARDNEKLDKIASAIDLSFNAKNIEQAHYLLFNEYIPLMSELGEDMLRAIQYVDVFEAHPLGQAIKSDVDVLKCVSMALNEEAIPAALLETVSNKLREGWGTFAFRREICSLLLHQNVDLKYIDGIDAVPKDEFKSNLEKH